MRASDIWGSWLVRVPPEVEYNKFRHFEFAEQSAARPAIEPELAGLLHYYHTRSPVNTNLLARLGFPRTAEALGGDLRPKSETTRKAHLVEILACEYAKRYGIEFPVLRLSYNPNPEQSMKGDDVLGFRFPADPDTPYTVLVGEAKYRGSYSSAVVLEAYEALRKGMRPYPISLEFVATILDVQDDQGKAERVQQIKALLKNSSPRVQRRNLLFVATEGRPRDPFGCLEELDNVLDPLVAVNISFEAGIVEWLNRVYEMVIPVEES